jgi:glycyl-tRNA synthetase beta chain
VTGTVGEFPELQGAIGRAYARSAGEQEAVAQAIYEHYLPTHAGGDLPSGMPGALISVADKIDTLVGCFGIGQIPSGTADPFALRRQALGIIRIILEKKLPLSLADLIDRALAGLDGKLTEPAEETRRGVLEFFRVRFENLLTGQGFSQDVVDAVLAYNLDPLAETMAKIEALKAFRDHKDFGPLLVTVKRVVNILKEEVDAAVNPLRFTAQVEKDLYRDLTSSEEELQKLLAGHNYGGALQYLIRLKAPIDRLFEDVLVLDKDPTIRRNRLALLSRVAGLFRHLADFSKLTA